MSATRFRVRSVAEAAREALLRQETSTPCKTSFVDVSRCQVHQRAHEHCASRTHRHRTSRERERVNVTQDVCQRRETLIANRCDAVFETFGGYPAIAASAPMGLACYES